MSAAASPEATVRRPQVWPLGVKAYHALGELGLIPERTELLYGQVFHKMPKAPLHTYLQQFLMDLLRVSLPSGMHVRSEQPITCGDSEPEPDLAVVRGSNDDYRHEHPHTAELVIEVCVSSHDYDRSKLRAYATAGVKECWLVLGPEKEIESHGQPGEGHYGTTTRHGIGELLASRAIPEFSVKLDRLFGA